MIGDIKSISSYVNYLNELQIHRMFHDLRLKVFNDFRLFHCSIKLGFIS
jgi:hypothetical protein